MKHSLLVVDDEPGIVETLYHMLRRDYDVYTATSAAEAFEVMRRRRLKKTPRGGMNWCRREDEEMKG